MRAHAHGHTLGHPHAHTYRQICNTYCVSTATVIHKHVSMLCYSQGWPHSRSLFPVKLFIYSYNLGQPDDGLSD